MKVKYYNDSKYAEFDGLKFTKDEHTGYYLNSTIQKRLHRYVYEYYNGPIEKGYDVHHKIDKSHNDIEDLELLTQKEHKEEHSRNMTDDQRERLRKNLNEKARPKAIEWHKSNESTKWHKEHYKQTADKMCAQRNKTCLNCGKEYTTSQINGKYCSNACKSSYRRKNKTDQIIKRCVFCGAEFGTDKYRPGRYCSNSCNKKDMWVNKKNAK